MAAVRVGFLFEDKSFFNAEVEASEIGPLFGANGNWKATGLAGKTASQKGVDLSCQTLKSFEVGGIYVGQVLDDTLYQQVDEENSTNTATSHENVFNTTGTEKQKDEKDERHHWSNEAVLLLLEEFKKNSSSFTSPLMTKRQAWKLVASNMQVMGYNLTGEACEKKFNNMKLRYKSIVDNNKATGRGTARPWYFFTHMQDLLCTDPSVVPPVTVSSLSGTKVNVPKRKLFDEMSTPNREHSTDQVQPEPLPAMETSTKKKPKKHNRENTPPSWFQEWTSSNQSLMTELINQTKRKNDLLEKLIEKM